MTNELFSTYAFGNQLPHEATHLHWTDTDKLQADQITLPKAGISDRDYKRALSDINETWDIATDSETGKTFEIAIANLGGIAAKGMDLEISTFSSSLSGNVGNAIELAMSSVAAGRPRLYVASLGNGGSNYLDRSEREYVRDTGRFTTMGDHALPTIQALARILEQQDHQVTRLSTNSAGGAHATALMAALPEGQITHAYFKSRPNIENHSKGKVLWAARLTVADKIDNARYALISTDPWRLTDERKSRATELLPRLRSAEAAAKLASVKRVTAVTKAWTDMIALSRGGREHHYPAVYDTVAALQQQPEARITHHIPDHDLHYREPRVTVPRFLEMVHAFKRTDDSDTEALIIPGLHGDHAHYPSLRWAAEKFAFNRTA